MRKKREKNIMPTRLLDKILDDQKSPPPPQELNDRPLSTLKQLYYTLIYISVSNIWINELGYRIPK